MGLKIEKGYTSPVVERYNRIKFKIAFVWGRIERVYNVGKYQIIEFYDYDTSQLCFAYVVENEVGTRHYETLEGAMSGAIAYNFEGCGHKADQYFMKMMGQ